MKGIELKALRESNGWTQDELAEFAGVSKRTVINWEQSENLSDSKVHLLHGVFRKSEVISKEVKGLKECADIVAQNYKKAKEVSKLLELTINNDNRDYLIAYLESKGFKVNS